MSRLLQRKQVELGREATFIGIVTIVLPVARFYMEFNPKLNIVNGGSSLGAPSLMVTSRTCTGSRHAWSCELLNS